MKSYILRRLLLLIPVLCIVLSVSFLVVHLMPGDPVRLILGPYASDEEVAVLRAQLGYDKPLFIQFGTWIKNFFSGDFGESVYLKVPVITAIASRMEPTLLLAIFGQLLGILIGLPLGVIAAVKHRTAIDQASIAFSLLGISVPNFLFALVFIFLFGVGLNWFPVAGYKSISKVGFGVVKYLFMPTLSLGIAQSGLIARMTRSAMLDVLQEDYIRTTRANGLRERTIIAKYALRNALTPVATTIGFSFAGLLAGTWIIESIFQIPGTGFLAISSITRRDYPVIQGCMLFIALIYMLMNVMMDIVYTIINPKVKFK